MSFCFWVFLCMVMRLKQKEIKFKPRIKLNHNKYIIHIIPATYLYTFQNKEFNALQYKSRNVFHYTYFWFSFIFSNAFGHFPFFSLFFAFFGNGFVHIFEQIVSIRVKKRSNTNLVAPRCNKISSRAPECVVW